MDVRFGSSSTVLDSIKKCDPGFYFESASDRVAGVSLLGLLGLSGFSVKGVIAFLPLLDYLSCGGVSRLTCSG